MVRQLGEGNWRGGVRRWKDVERVISEQIGVIKQRNQYQPCFL